MKILEVKDLKKIYKIQSDDGKSEEEITILNGINLNIESGEYVAIVGPSGSGKSTLMQIIGLLDNSFKGEVRFLGKDITSMSDDEISDLRGNYVGFVFQSFNLLSRTTALENVNLPLVYSRHDFKDRASNLLDMVGLSDRKDNLPNQLSGGQQQRVAIARALVNYPKIIFADEPTGKINQLQSKEVMNYFSKLNALGVTIVIVTHDPKVASCAKRIIKIVDGRIESDCENQEFKKEDELDIDNTQNIKIKDSLDKNNSKEEKVNSNFLESFLSKEKLSFLKENILVALKALVTNKFRTFLSMLGIAIGIASVVVMIALGEGAKADLEKEWIDDGAGYTIIYGRFFPDTFKFYPMKNKDFRVVKQMEKYLPIEHTHRIRGSYGDVNIFYLDKKVVMKKHWSLLSTDISHYKASNISFMYGDALNEEQEKNRARVCIIGSSLYKKLFKEGENPIGKKIYISLKLDSDKTDIRSQFTIVGVMSPRSDVTQTYDTNERVYISYSAGNDVFWGHGDIIRNGGIGFTVKNIEYIEYIKNKITHRLAESRNIKDIDALIEKDLVPFNIENVLEDDSIKNMQQVSDTMEKLLILLASISLLVGGIGIMNIMIVSVKERTKEIGLRKALGARKLDVLFQFITEAMMVGLIGGGSGVILGVIIALILSIWISSVLPISMIVISFVFSFFIAVLFGFLPAKQAAKLSPVEALKYE